MAKAETYVAANSMVFVGPLPGRAVVCEGGLIPSQPSQAVTVDMPADRDCYGGQVSGIGLSRLWLYPRRCRWPKTHHPPKKRRIRGHSNNGSNPARTTQQTWQRFQPALSPEDMGIQTRGRDEGFAEWGFRPTDAFNRRRARKNLWQGDDEP